MLFYSLRHNLPQRNYTQHPHVLILTRYSAVVELSLHDQRLRLSTSARCRYFTTNFPRRQPDDLYEKTQRIVSPPFFIFFIHYWHKVCGWVSVTWSGL